MARLNPPTELSLDFKPTFLPKTISQFLGEVERIGSVSEKILKVDDFVCRLETEIKKIDAFRRELPLCMLLMNDAIVALKEELMVFKESQNQPALKEFIPLKKTCDDDPKVETDGVDKKNWWSSTQICNTNANKDTDQNHIQKQNSVEQVIPKRAEEDQDGMFGNPYCGNSGREFIPIKGFCGFTFVGTSRNEDKEEEMLVSELSLVTPGSKNPMSGTGFIMKTGDTNKLVPCSIPIVQENIEIGAPQPPQQQTSRKQRRCWSVELHRCFVNALQQLGGSKAATPKQIRELMQVDGLTNDEVKSHLQKYRLHSQKLPSSNTSSNPPAVGLGGYWTPPQDHYFDSSSHKNPQLRSPDGPLLNCNTSDSMDDGEDEKSENNCWKGQLYTSVKDNV